MPKDAPAPTVESVVAMEAANIPIPNPRDKKQVANVINRFARDARDAKDLREMIENGSSVDEIFKKHFKGGDPDGPSARHFRAEIAKAVK